MIEYKGWTTKRRLVLLIRLHHGGIDDADQTINEQRMKNQWMPPTPIETLFEHLDDGRLFSAKGHEVIDDTQLMRWAYDNIKNTGLFDRDCEKWRKKPQTEKDWAAFQKFFFTADEDRKKNAPTASEATYTANQVQEILQNKITSFLQTPPESTDDTPSTPTVSANASVTTEDVHHMIAESLATHRSSQITNRSNHNGVQGTSPPHPPTMCQALINQSATAGHTESPATSNTQAQPANVRSKESSYKRAGSSVGA